MCVHTYIDATCLVDYIQKLKYYYFSSSPAGLDYFNVMKDITFRPQSTRKRECMQIQLIDDTIVERNEQFTVRLSSQQEDSAIVLNPRGASIQILDDDGEQT